MIHLCLWISDCIRGAEPGVIGGGKERSEDWKQAKRHCLEGLVAEGNGFPTEETNRGPSRKQGHIPQGVTRTHVWTAVGVEGWEEVGD